jgi:lysophospholipase L1-like esterase
MLRIVCALFAWLLYMPVMAGTTNDPDSLHTGIYDYGTGSYTLRWATNDQTLTNAPRVLGLGSSTLAGYLLSYPDRLGDKIGDWLGNHTINATWINLAVAGYASTNIMPTSDGGNPGTNIDSALATNPDFIFISLPTNDIANGLTINQILANFRKLDTIAQHHGIPVFWETTQPRNTFTAAQQTMLKVLADSIRNAWPQRYVEAFSTTVNTTASTDAIIRDGYGAGDGVHLNTTGNQPIADSLFDRWQRYFQSRAGVIAYEIDTMRDGGNWGPLENVTTVKKTYTGKDNITRYFKVRAFYTDGHYSSWSNTVTLFGNNSTQATAPVITLPRILVDLGGDGVHTTTPDGVAHGQLTTSPDQNGYYWNNWIGATDGSGFKDGGKIKQLVSTTDSTTGISLTLIGQPDGTYNTTAPTRAINYTGLGAAVGDYPASAVSDNMFLHNSINPTGVKLRIKGLVRNKIYNIKLWGARVDATTTPRILEAQLDTAIRTMDSRYGTADVGDYNRAIVFSNIYDKDSIDIQLRVGSGSTFASLSVLDITAKDSSCGDATIAVNGTVNVPAGTVVSLTSTITNGGTTPVYQWMDSTITHDWQNISGGSNATLNYTPVTTGDKVRCQLTSSLACAGTEPVISNALAFTVRDTTTCMPAVIIDGPTDVSKGSFVQLTSAISNGGDIPVYQWMDSTATHDWLVISGDIGLIYTPQETGDKVRCELISNAPCARVSTVYSNTLVFTSTTCVAAIRITGNNDVTVGTPVTLTSTITNGGTTPVYQWMDSTSTHNWQVIGSDMGLNYTPAKTGDAVRCQLTTNSLCARDATVNSNTIVFNVRDTATCSGAIVIQGSVDNPIYTQVVISSVINNGGSSPVYQWMDSTATHGWQNLATGATLYYKPVNTGDKVQCLLTSSLICAGLAPVYSNVLTFTVRDTTPVCIPGVNISGVTEVFNMSHILLTTYTINAGLSPTFQWIDSTATHGWQTIPNATSSTLLYSPLKTGDEVICQMTSSLTCAGATATNSNILKFTVHLVTATGTSPASRYGIRLYPNPVRDILVLDSIKLSDHWISLDIISTNGQQVLTTTAIKEQTSIQIPVKQLVTGTYIVALRKADGTTATLKFIRL